MLRRKRWLATVALVAVLLGTGGRAPANEPGERIVKISAKKFEYVPAKIFLKRGVPVTLELTALDRKHGFAAPELGLRSDVTPGAPVRLRFVPDKLGTFAFHCDIFCGDGHEGMSGEIIVQP
jgi:cytochrome c oxidase subunit 2